MRTSIELSDGLVERARRLAKHKGVTLRAVVEEALDRLLCESEAVLPFRLEPVTFGDGGFVPDIGDGECDWERIRELANGAASGEAAHRDEPEGQRS